MAVTVTYTNFGGLLLHEDRAGVERQYLSDPLGSLVGELNSAQSVTYTAEYWPSGEIQVETGVNTSDWSFLGLIGYLRDVATLLYVRARHYLVSLARWLTSDPLWPEQLPYAYVENNPITSRDPSGLGPVIVLGTLVIGAAAAEALSLILGIALLTLLLLLLYWGWRKFLSWLCRRLYWKLKSICGDTNDGRPSDVQGACCWSDSCLSLFYKFSAYKRCAEIRVFYSLLCYGGIDPSHLPPIYENALLAGQCILIFRLKCAEPWEWIFK